jgi:hypothetical protein
MSNPAKFNSELLSAIRDVLTQSRTQLQKVVNHTMVHAYWHVGRFIVEHEQEGEDRAAYGEHQLKNLARQLQTEFSKGFNERKFSDPSNLDRSAVQIELDSSQNFTWC